MDNFDSVNSDCLFVGVEVVDMQYCCSYKELPEEILFSSNRFNVFYSEEYEKNVLLRGQKQIYLWDDYYVLVARVKKVLFAQGAVLETEPQCIQEGGDQKAFLTEAVKQLGKCGVQWTVCATTARFQEYPEGGQTVPSGNYIIDLSLSEEELFKNVHSKHRNTIRRGEKAKLDLKIGHDELIADYTKIAIETYARSGKSSVGYNYYKSLTDGLDTKSVFFMIYKNGEAQSGALFYYNNQVAYYLHGASIGRPEPGATNYLMWRAILYFKEMGVKEFSFVGYRFNPGEGSKLEGIQRFKERFGGRLEKSYNFRFVQNAFMYRLYGVAMQIKAKRPFEKYRDAVDEQIDRYPELNE